MTDTPNASKAIASERAFIGAVINGDARAADHLLTEKDFQDPFCKSLFALCAQLESQGKQPDLVTLSDTDAGLDMGAVIALTNEAAPVSALIEQHAGNIRDASRRRRAQRVCLAAAQAIQDEAKPLEGTLFKARELLDQLNAAADMGDTIGGVDAMADFLLWMERKEGEAAISTGFPGLDEKLGGGLIPGRLTVIGARPAVGKSALMSAMALSAIREGRRVLYVSLEMGAREIITRMAAALSGVNTGRIFARSPLSDEEIAAVAAGCTRIGGEAFAISTGACTPGAIRRTAMKMRAQGGLDLICVDYLQLMRSDMRTNNRAEAVGDISRSLKLLAMEMNVPILAAAQVNRACASGEERAPRLSELRESGSIEQDADVVLLLHMKEKEMQKPGARMLEMAVAKNRQGSCGVTCLLFDGRTMRFETLPAA